MARTTLYRAVGVLTLVIGSAALASADPPAPAKDDAANKRLLYVVKHGSAKDLATVLGQHFKGVAEIQALPDPSSNFLLISSAPAAFDDILKTLEQLDRAPQTVEVEILIADVATKKADGDKTNPLEEVDEKALTGTFADVMARAEALQKKGALSGLKHILLTAVEGRPASVLVGESRPYTTAINISATGRDFRGISYRNSGIQANATVHVSPVKVVSVDLKLEESYPYVPEEGVSIGKDENGKPVMATEFVTSTLNDKIDVTSGQARVAEGVKTQAKSGKSHTIVVIGATVIEPDAKPDK